jgi:hypothetical protein
MKVIVSHDIDHITAWEHSCDLFIPKFLIRSSIDFFLRKISLSELAARISNIMNNKLNNIKEIMNYDKNHKIHSTFFIGVKQGRSMNYSLNNVEIWVKTLLKNGFDIGLHGIAYDNKKDIREEFKLFKKLSGLEKFGVRIHYLLQSKNTFVMLNDAGYLFDATMHGLQNPYLLEDMWMFPIQIMDVWIMQTSHFFRKVKLSKIQQDTITIIEQAEKLDMKYLSILFHDCYFNEAFRQYKEWYIWIIKYLQKKGIEFINYQEAILELNRKL